MNILFVDDNIEYGREFKALFERFGFNIHQVRNALDAQALFNQKSNFFDLIIVEGRPQGLSALQLISEIKDVNDDIPIVALSDHMDVLERLVSAKAGADFGANKTLDENGVQELMNKMRELYRVYR